MSGGRATEEARAALEALSARLLAEGLEAEYARVEVDIPRNDYLAGRRPPPLAGLRGVALERWRFAGALGAWVRAAALFAEALRVDGPIGSTLSVEGPLAGLDSARERFRAHRHQLREALYGLDRLGTDVARGYGAAARGAPARTEDAK